MPSSRRTKKPKPRRPFSAKGGPNGAGWHEGVASRLNEVAGGYILTDIARMTGANAETIRRYMNTGRIPVQFLSVFCLAFRVDPGWMLFGRSSRRAGAGRRT